MSKRYELRKGDMCPCCGQTIETDDPEVLSLLTVFALGVQSPRSTERWLRTVGFEWPEADDG